jgi:phage recombination protein Bet
MNQKTNPQPAANIAVLESERLAKTELVRGMSSDAQLDPNAFISTVMRTCFDVEVTKEQFLAFLLVANEYGLNPLTKEIHGFAKGGKVVPIVGIDGWLNMINKRSELDGIEYEDHRNEGGGIEAITCIIYRNDRKHPTKVTEYLSECKMETSTWKKWPTRMLRHKATIQCARVSFGFSGIYDPDEAERIRQGESDIVGHATVVEDEPQGAAERIVSKIAHKAEAEQFAPESENPAPAEAESVVIDNDTGEIQETEKPKVEDIPGVTKGAKDIKPPTGKTDRKPVSEQSNEEYVEALEGKGKEK